MIILDEIKGAKKIAIGGHIRPDGDCVGSCMAMYLYLRKAVPDAEVSVYLEKPADVFGCIKNVSDIKTEIDEEDPVDVFIVQDCADDRLGFHLERPFRNLVDQLFKNRQRFIHFIQTNHIPGVRIALQTDNFLKLHPVIGSIRLVFAQVAEKT